MSKYAKKFGVSEEWVDLLCSLPGYDPFIHADGCWFDPEAAQAAIDFFPQHLQHIEGAMRKKPFVLQRWQQAILANAFGWKRKDEFGRNVRRYREIFCMVPRKNGKTPFVAGMALLVFFLDPEEGQQNFVAAGSKGQAAKLFRQCAGMVKLNPDLEEMVEVYGGTAQGGQSRSIVDPETESFIQIISADANTSHGDTTHFAVVDELHVQPDRELVDTIQTGTASANRKNPMFVSITTAGHDRNSICYEKYRYACEVRDNDGDKEKPGYDPAFLPVVYEAKAEDDWTSPDVWKRANPNLGVSVSMSYLERECKKAKRIPDYENTFRQLHLDQWTEQANRWLSMTAWDKGAEPFDPKSLVGVPAFAGLDLAATDDLCAFAMVFDHDDSYWVLPHFWCPETKVERRHMAGVAYATWRDKGFLTVTPGDTTDYTQIFDDICALRDVDGFAIQEIGFDPAEALMLAKQLEGAGFDMWKFPQTHTNFNEPCKLLETWVVNGKIRHGGHKVLRWNAANVALDRKIQRAMDGNSVQQAALRMPSKAKSGEKIDGIVALLMAIGRMMANPGAATGPSIFFMK